MTERLYPAVIYGGFPVFEEKQTTGIEEAEPGFLAPYNEPTPEERGDLEVWTTVRRFSERRKLKSDSVGKWLLERWVQRGHVEKHDDGLTAPKYRLKGAT